MNSFKKLAVLVSLTAAVSIFSVVSASAADVGKVISSSLNIRSGPGTNYEVIDTFGEGTTFLLSGKEGDWWKVDLGYCVGYVNASYVSVNGQMPATAVASTTSSVASAPAATTMGSQVVEYAKQFLGTRYVYGGASPSGFDCSGFVQYVYKHFGVSLNRVAADQAKNGYWVAKENLQPGDLVFFAKPGRAIHHVGIYVGNGNYIHSPQTGDVVKIAPMTRSDYYTARRIF